MVSSLSPRVDLVGNLVEIAERLGAFAVEAADGEADLVDRLDDLADLVAEDQAGQVQHGGGAHAGAEVGRAGGEVAERRDRRRIRAISPVR